MNSELTPIAEEQAEFPLEPALDFLRRLWRLNHAFERLSSKMEKRLGITAQQRVVLRCVGRFPAITPGQLAQVLHLDPGTISAMLRRLEHKKLVERRKHATDRRRFTLGLTKKGRALDAPISGTVDEAADALLAQSPKSQASAASALLEQFTEALNARLGL